MATKSAVENGDNQSSALSTISGNAAGVWGNFTRFLSDVRAEMRKVVTPTRNEVRATTSVVIVTVFLFGFFFMVVDRIFGWSLQAILHRLGGTQ
jgi:preprotein translocase subunit SecE